MKQPVLDRRHLREWVRRRLYLVCQRSSRGQLVFSSRAEYGEYLTRLIALAARSRVRIHAYCLTPREVRFLFEPLERNSISRLMQDLQGGYARWIHQQLGVEGHLWKGKFGALEIAPRDFAATVAALEQFPVTLHLARRPSQWPYSSARTHALGPGPAAARSSIFYPPLFWPRFLANPNQPPATLPNNLQAWRFRFGSSRATPSVVARLRKAHPIGTHWRNFPRL